MVSIQNSSCKTFNLFCNNNQILNVDFLSSDQLKYPIRPIENTLCLSGGGSRSFLLSTIIMRELEQKKKLQNFTTVGSVSGGSWANCMFQYGKYDSREIYLGKAMQPEEITMNKIKTIDSKCVLSCVNNKITTLLENAEDDLRELLVILANGNFNISSLWKYFINQFYLKPFSVSSNKFYVNNQEQLDNILQTQPSLSANDFILPTSSNFPYPFFMSTLVGPTALKPYQVDINAQYTIFELSSYATGVFYAPNNGVVKYENEKKTDSKNIQVAGFINSQAFNGTLQNNKTTVSIKEKNSILDAISLSSWAPGGFIDSIDLFPEGCYYEEKFTNKNTTLNMLFIDGGNANNLGIIPMVQRISKNIFACINTQTKFNYYIDESYNYDTSNLPTDISLAGLFGIINNEALNDIDLIEYDLQNMHIFKKEHYNILVQSMYEVEQKGDGIVCTVEVETIKNTWYNIPAGNKITLTLFYNSLPSNWYNQLDDSIKDFVDEKNLPFISTKIVEISPEEIHLMDSMTTWTMQKYIDKF